jgi:hypothetical protein
VYDFKRGLSRERATIKGLSESRKVRALVERLVKGVESSRRTLSKIPIRVYLLALITSIILASCVYSASALHHLAVSIETLHQEALRLEEESFSLLYQVAERQCRLKWPLADELEIIACANEMMEKF